MKRTYKASRFLPDVSVQEEPGGRGCKRPKIRGALAYLNSVENGFPTGGGSDYLEKSRAQGDSDYTMDSGL
jgi:hypothetical protein